MTAPGGIWIRRGAITAPLGAKTATDRKLLAEVVEANLADSEFFIRKATGWALPDFSASDRTGCAVSWTGTRTSSARCRARRLRKLR